ncbi:MAG: PA14 domain-containing protein [Planctomycetota bacterium]|jgi:hypothetical protein
MRDLKDLLLVLAIVCGCTVASANAFTEDFESYTAGSELHGQGGWKGWDNSPGAGAPVSNAYAYSGSNSVEIGGSSDLVHEFDISGGVWEFTVMQYIPSGTSGNNYFILLNSYDDGANQDWSVQLPIDLATGLMTSAYDGAVGVNILYDQWVELKFVIDLDNNVVDEYYNGELFSTHQWDDNDHGTIGAIDLYSEGASSIYYDDIAITAPINAFNPGPADNAVIREKWTSISWSVGAFAESHDVYFGENYDDVADGTEEAFRGNNALPYYVVGFTGYPYPEGLVPGTTYYWRIDEVNDLHPDSPVEGDVWSFMVAPNTAFEPVPSDGGKFVDTDNPVLSWTEGMGSKLHTVYFGDDYDTVANDTGGQSQSPLDFRPGSLETEKTYYWRVDEFVDDENTYKGNVWSFTTAKVGGGVRGDYYHWNDPAFVGGGGNPGPVQAFTTFMLTRTDPQIDFSWGSGSPDPAVNADRFSARWTGEVEAAFTETYTFYASSDDGSRLWIDDKLLVDQWIDQGTTERSGTIDLVAGNTYSLVMEYYETGGGTAAQLRWSSESTPKQFVPQAALSLPVKARSPKPRNGTVGVRLTDILTWKSGDYAASHEVYFGTDQEAIGNATKVSPEYKGARALGDENFDPGKLAWDTTYYWRIDEVNDADPNSPWVGNVWSFATGDFLVVDDFEFYDVGNNEIWWAWKDGLGYVAHGSEPAYPGNGTGSAVGDETTASYTEEIIVHDGRQSMPLFYDNNKQGCSNYSEVELTLIYPRDWTEYDVNTLSLWFIGDSANAAEPLYVALNGTAVVYNDNTDAAQIAVWTQWNIDLQEFAGQGVDMTNVNTIAIGLGTKGNVTTPGGAGKICIDDIRLLLPEPQPIPEP